MKEYIIKVNESDLTPSEKMCLRDYHPTDLMEKGKTMNDLKPCPFCGRKVRLVNVSEVGFKCDIWVIVHEEKEPVCFLWHNKGYEGKKKDIVKLWNQRIFK